LQRRPWPGNVRELANALERAAILRPHGPLQRPHVAEPGRAPGHEHAGAEEHAPGHAAGRSGASMHDAGALAGEPGGGDGRPRTLREVERRHVAAVLELTGGKIYGADGAAALLGLKPTTLQSRLRKLGLRGRGRLDEGGEGRVSS
jgi:DNA-binding NtrC family response regulator